MKRTQYSFTSKWKIDAPASTAESIIKDVKQWPRWWSSLQNISVDRANDTDTHSVNMQWEAPLGYTLAITIHIKEHQPAQFIRFTSRGDLEGEGVWQFEEHSGITLMTILWNVATTKRWMNTYAPLLRPLFVMSHTFVMRRGQHGLRKYLADQHISRKTKEIPHVL